MLNELKEYEQYTVLPVSPEESRLRYDNFIKAKLSEGKTLFPGGPLSGLERVMTIVARYHLFNLGLEEDNVKEILKAWCGFKHDESIANDSSNINAWLERLIRQVFLKTYLNEASEYYRKNIKNHISDEKADMMITELLEDVAPDDTVNDLKFKTAKLEEFILPKEFGSVLTALKKNGQPVDIACDILKNCVKQLEEESNVKNKILEILEKTASETTLTQLKERKKELNDVLNKSSCPAYLDSLVNKLNEVKEVRKDNKAEYINQLKSELEKCTAELKKVRVFRDETITMLGNIDLLNNLDQLNNIVSILETWSEFPQVYVGKICRTCNTLIKLSNKKNQFSRGVFTYYPGNDNDYKAITYESVIANALTMDKLDNYYLIICRNPFNNIFIKTKKKIKNLNDSQKDFLLKAIAVYLLQKRYTDQSYVYFNKTDLANWTGKRSDSIHLENYLIKREGNTPESKSSDKTVKDTNTIDMEPLFDKISVGVEGDKEIKQGTNVTKLKIDPDWLKAYGFAIIKQCELDRIDKAKYPEFVVYEDEGSGKVLKEIKL